MVRINPKSILSNKQGFTLVELLVVIAIIGILAAIAIPNFVKFQCRAKQAEARTSLKAIYTAQEAYRAEFDQYTFYTGGCVAPCVSQAPQSDANPMHFNIKGNKFRYTYSVIYDDFNEDCHAVDPAQQDPYYCFVALAEGGAKTDMKGDTWSINQNNALKSYPGKNVCD